jgi:hypothetical protein
MTATKTKPMDSKARVKERIGNDLAGHTITLLHGNGLYRHWRCQRPNTWNMGFDIVTWPGSLCFTGDMGEYLFQRTADMVPFMRESCMSYSYAAEKCTAHDGRLKEFSEERFEEILTERLKEADEEGGTFRVMRRGTFADENVADALEEIRNAYSQYSMASDATKAMYESGLWDGCDLPSCEVYTFHFLWCLHAIKWFTKKLETEASS